MTGAGLHNASTNTVSAASGFPHTFSACAVSVNPDDLNECPTLSNATAAAFSAGDRTTIEKLDYDGGHTFKPGTNEKWGAVEPDDSCVAPMLYGSQFFPVRSFEPSASIARAQFFNVDELP